MMDAILETVQTHMTWALHQYVQPVLNTANSCFDHMIDCGVQYEPNVERTLMSQRSDPPSLMFQQWIHQPLEGMSNGVSEAFGLDLLSAKYILAMLMTYPLSLIFRALPGRVAKNIFALAAGVALAQFVFGVAWIHGALSAGVAYILMYMTMCIPPLQNFGHIVVFLWMMLYMGVSHIYRMKVDYMGWSPDFTGPQMLITIKVTAFAYNIIDGTTNRRRYEAERKNAKSPGARKQAETRLKLSLEQLPDPLEYYAWIYHYGLYFAGPAFELRRYQDALTGDAYKVDNEKGSSVFWSSIRATLLKLLQACFFLVFFQVVTAFVPFEQEVAPERLKETSFVQLINRAFWMWIALVAVQTKYYFVWKLSEGGANLAGFGFEPSEESKKSGQFIAQDWDAVSQIDVTGFQTASNIQMMTRSWNQRTQWWLEHYVYRRAPRSFGINMILTYFVSAFWHGFYGGYYLFFLSVPLFSELDKRLRPVFNPLFYVDDKGNPSVSGKVRDDRKFLERVYHVFCCVITTMTTLYLVTTFVVLDWNKGMAVWRSFHFAPHIGAVLLHLIVFVLPAHKPKRKTA